MPSSSTTSSAPSTDNSATPSADLQPKADRN
jgi:hypothetical protein